MGYRGETMRGFTGFYHYGHPCFIREEYEEEHFGEDELTRLEDALGMTFSDADTAIYYVLTHAKYMLYRCESDEIDRELLCGRDPWIAYKDGYVHAVTGEYVIGLRPSRDSYPCWKKSKPAADYFNPHSLLQVSGKIGLLALAVGFIATLLSGGDKR